jgi:hypothetical protein
MAKRIIRIAVHVESADPDTVPSVDDCHALIGVPALIAKLNTPPDPLDQVRLVGFSSDCGFTGAEKADAGYCASMCAFKPRAWVP